MDCCLLCLEINKDLLDCINVNSTQWQDLHIAQTIDKHFWSLNTIRTSSWICASCWREVENFHKFYLRIEEAHGNFGKIKSEHVESDKDNSMFCIIEEEVLLGQAQQMSYSEPEVIKGPLIDSSVYNETMEIRVTDTMVPISKDPLEKSYKSRKKNSIAIATLKENSTEEKDGNDSKVKVEPVCVTDDDLESLCDNNDASDINYQLEKDLLVTSKNKRRKSNSHRKEYDKFIAENFRHMSCVLCEVSLKNFTDMHKHFNEFHKQRGYVVCCKRKFSERTRIVDHLRCHLNPDYFKCNQCGKTMSDRRKFDTHMLLIHRANEVVKKHCCDICGKSFRQAYVLRTHKLIHLPKEEKKYPCSDCGKNYRTPAILKQHMQVVHLKRFVKVCYICGKEITSSVEFKAHMDKHEGVPLPVINCDVCGLRLTTERGLKRHKETQHPVDGKKDYPCPICPKISPTLKAVRKHINTMHVKGYDYKCTICQKEFKRPEALREHMASHTGTPLYTCPWCPKTFNSNGNMHAHRKKIHPKEWEEAKLRKYSGNLKSTSDIAEDGYYAKIFRTEKL